jgi:hypothetical protein
MPKATTCLLDRKEISVSKALDLRDRAKRKREEKPDFRCRECGEAVRPHNAGGKAAAHIEHLERNRNCSLSDPPR